MSEVTEPEPADPRDETEGVPLCTGCGRPVEGDGYYCPHCGAAVNNLTPYIPYVDIPFNYSPYAEMWRSVTGKRKAGVAARVLCAAMILFFAPIMLLGLIFVLVEWLRNRKRKPDAAPPPDSTDGRRAD